MKKAYFLPNGNIACFEEGKEQIPYLQKSYVELYCEYLEKQNQNPEKMIFIMPNGHEAKPIKLKMGWNWEFI